MAWKTALRVDILPGQTMYFEWAKPVATELQCGLRENVNSVDDGWPGAVNTNAQRHRIYSAPTSRIAVLEGTASDG